MESNRLKLTHVQIDGVAFSYDGILINLETYSISKYFLPFLISATYDPCRLQIYMNFNWGTGRYIIIMYTIFLYENGTFRFYFTGFQGTKPELIFILEIIILCVMIKIKSITNEIYTFIGRYLLFIYIMHGESMDVQQIFLSIFWKLLLWFFTKINKFWY